MRRFTYALLALLLCAAAARAQNVPVQEVMLDNGLRVLMVPRKGDPNIAAGWITRTGSVNERPGITGLSHLFEHMMFKGTRTLGTKNIEENLKLLKDMDDVRAQIRAEEKELIRRQRLGEIADVKDPKNRSEKHKQLLARFEELTKREKELMVKDEFDRVYTTAGASGMNAGTSNDFTVYFINVPANKLELWFWMESDRLANPVFREFYSERDVVYEERRLRTDSTPTGKFDEQFEAMFWMSSPYGWPVVGWPSDLEGITREEALDYFAVNYAPNNLTACLVGDFEPANATTLAKKYFGRLPRGPREPEPVRTQEMQQLAEQRMVAYAETSPQARVRYHTVADGHADEYALVVLGDLLSGRTGRLYKSLVLQQEVANNASGGQNGNKYEGYFELRGTAKPGKSPEDVEQALYKEIEKIQKEPVPADELQKVKNQSAANQFRGLQSNFGLMVQLLLRDANRGWATINTDEARTQAVTPADIQRVANKYFKPENRTVAIYRTKQAAAGAAAEDAALAGLSDEEKAQIQQLRAMLPQLKAEQVRAILQQVEQSAASAPADKQKGIQVVKKMLEERLKQLEGGTK
ncbi:MAG TPA: pitrilysin family protein [Pyrinomonadaceae bacterium]|jgi:predicted Zn-dependent peptidase|nr:pitrilysin family protein [Pyrinomonadaceae bacterium]